MSFGWRLPQPKLLTLLMFLGIMLSTSLAHASNSDRRLTVFLMGGSSSPVGDFDAVAKAGFNWGGGAELAFRSNWAIGIVVHRVEFRHQDVWYDSWHRSWRYTDWTFIRGNWYGKYILRKKGVSPFFKVGIGVYSMENRRTLVGSSQVKSQNNGVSLVPGAGLEYLTKKVLFFIETDYNIVLRKSMGGCQWTNREAQFFEFFFGVGFFVLNF